METKEDNEYILKTYIDKKDERDMDIDIDMGIDDSNLEFEEEVELTGKRIVTEKKKRVPEKTEKSKVREKKNRKITVPNIKASVVTQGGK